MLLSFFFFKQKTAYEMRISDWSSDVCSSDLSSGAMVTRSPSRPASIEIWQESREFALRWELLSSRSFSSSPTGGSLSAQASSTKTWQFAQEQPPPQSERTSPKPASRITSLTDRPHDSQSEELSEGTACVITVYLLCIF